MQQLDLRTIKNLILAKLFSVGKICFIFVINQVFLLHYRFVLIVSVFVDKVLSHCVDFLFLRVREAGHYHKE